MIETRECNTCHVVKPVVEFKKNRQWWAHRCKACQTAWDAKYRHDYTDRNRERVQARERAKTRARYTAEGNRERQATEKGRARHLLRVSVARGKIVKPTTCQTCGSEANVQGHHHVGYDRPLDVLWLCSRCHGLEHRKPVRAALAEPEGGA